MNKFLLGLIFAVLLPFAQSANASDWLYRMQQGDTLWDLCLKYTNKRGCWIELGKYNNIKRGRYIKPGTVIQVPASWLRTLPKVGEVSAVQGQVTYIAANGDETPLSHGQDLTLGASIRSGSEGSATIILGSHKQILLRPNSELVLESASSFEQTVSDAELRLETGGVEASVRKGTKSRFQIKTPAAIAAVRGTRYRVVTDAKDNVTRSEVLDGAISFGRGKTVNVPAGFGAAAKKGKPPEPPRALLPAPKLDSASYNVPLPAQLKWQGNKDAVAWQVDVYAPTQNSLLFSRRVNEPEVTFTDLAPECYRVHVSAIDSGEFQGMESIATLCVVAPVAPVSKVSVVVSENDVPTVSWPQVAGASQYRVVMASDENFSEVTWHKLVNTTELQLPQVVDSRMWVKVIAVDEFGNTSDGVVETFTTEKTDWRLVVGMGLFVLVALL